MAQPTIYLDHAAATPIDPRVLAAMQPYFTEKFYNPSALYLAAKDVAKDLQAARSRIAHHLGARPSEVIFTAGGTEANNLAIHGVMQRFPGSNIVASAIEHESVLAPAGQYDHRQIPVQPDGQLDISQLEKLIDNQTVLVSVMYANNEIGTIQPIRQISALIQTIRQQRKSKLPLYLHVDACQAAAYLDLHVGRLGADLLTINGGKIYGPKQSGALYARTGVELAPQLLGGGQERGQRSGTENVPAIIGLATALDLVQTDRKAESARLQTLQKQFFKLIEEKLPTATINGSRTHRLPNNIHLTIPGTDNERLIMALDEANIQAAAGSACSASTDEPSHVLKAIGLSEADAQASLRFTIGHSTDEAAIRRTVDTLAALIA